MNNTLELIEKAKQGDMKAREDIVNNNVGLIWSIVKRFYNRGHEPEDLFQIGAIGLLKAIDKFDSTYEVQFSTYAVPMIMGEVKRFIRDDGIIKVSRSVKELAIKAMSVKEIMTKENGAEPTIKELAARLEVDAEELVSALEAGARPESIYNTSDNGNQEGQAIVDRIEAPEDYESTIINRLLLKEALGKFEEREQKIILLRYFKQKTQSEVARLLGVSQVQVSRLEKKILEQMRGYIIK